MPYIERFIFFDVQIITDPIALISGSEEVPGGVWREYEHGVDPGVDAVQ